MCVFYPNPPLPPRVFFFNGPETKQGLVCRKRKMRNGRKKKKRKIRNGRVVKAGVEVLVLGEGEALSYLLRMIKMEKRADTISLIGT